jgi:hypothetical protein
MTYSEARQFIQGMAERRKRGLCTFRQANQLARNGFDTDLTMAQAGVVMTALAENNWRLNPEQRQAVSATIAAMPGPEPAKEVKRE